MRSSLECNLLVLLSLRALAHQMSKKENAEMRRPKLLNSNSSDFCIRNRGNQTRVNVLTENSEAFELHVLDQNRYSEGEFHLGAPSGRAAEGHRRTTGLL